MRNRIISATAIVFSLLFCASVFLSDSSVQSLPPSTVGGEVMYSKSALDKASQIACSPNTVNPFAIQQNCNASVITAANPELQTAATNNEDLELSSKFLSDTFKSMRTGDSSAMLEYVSYSIACNLARPESGTESSYCQVGHLSTYDREFEDLATLVARRGDTNASLALAKWYFSKLNDMQSEANINSTDAKSLLADPKYVELNSRTKKYLLNLDNGRREVASMNAMLSMYDSAP